MGKRAEIYSELDGFLGKISAFEIFLVWMSAKNAARIEIDYIPMISLIEFCERNGLFFELADFKIAGQNPQAIKGFGKGEEG